MYPPAAAALLRRRPMIGELLILDAESQEAADAFLAGAPYAKAGLFEKTELLRWDWDLGVPRKP